MMLIDESINRNFQRTYKWVFEIKSFQVKFCNFVLFVSFRFCNHENFQLSGWSLAYRLKQPRFLNVLSIEIHVIETTHW